MCLSCDGYSHEEIMRGVDLRIRTHGYTMTHVEAGDDEPSWSYSIGLTENFDHPDIVVTDLDVRNRHRLGEFVATMVVDDGQVDHAHLAEHGMQLVPVLQRHLDDGLVAMWEDRYGASAKEGQILQLLVPPSWHRCTCPDHLHRLDTPDGDRIVDR